jgi:hypothetical protein
VQYVTANLLSPPQSWTRAFKLVVEVFTLQVLTGPARLTAFAQTAQLVAPGGRLLIIAGAREEHDALGNMPWPLTRAEIESFRGYGLRADSIVDFLDDEAHGPIRRWRAWFTAPQLANPSQGAGLLIRLRCDVDVRLAFQLPQGSVDLITFDTGERRANWVQADPGAGRRRDPGVCPPD